MASLAWRWLGFVDRSQRFNPLFVTVAIFLVLLIGLVDILLEPMPGLITPLYLIPALLVTSAVGFRAGVGVLLACVAMTILIRRTAPNDSSSWAWIFSNVVSRAFAGAVSISVLWILQQGLRQEIVRAHQDALTKVANRRAFFEQGEQTLLRLRRAGLPLSVAYIDIDNFKTINDDLGHGAGDTVLCTIADAIRSSIRSGDMVARLGGDEFVILMPNARAEEASRMIGRST